MKRTIAHIINPFKAALTSDLNYAQPITFETMKRAREMAEKVVNVELMAACFPEDLEILPEGFKSTSPLENSVLKQQHFAKKDQITFP